MDRQFFKQLDDAEGKLLDRWHGWLDRSIKVQWREIERLQGKGPEVLSRLPPLAIDAGYLARLLSGHGAEIFAAGQAHGQLLVDDLHRRFKGRKMADMPGFDFEYGEDPRIVPEKAIKAMESRSIILAGDIDGALSSSMKKIIVNFLAGGTRPEAEQALQELLVSNKERATLITTTETTYSYNRGRLASFAENRVDYVRFSAVMDGRTSPICRSRDGLIMKMDDPKLPGNTPPLHGRCRSILSPVYGAYQPEMITDENMDWSGVAPLPKGWKTAE